MKRPPRSQDDNRNDVDKHCDDDYDGDNNDNHRGAVETNKEESDGSDCYLEPLHNTKIWYVVV